MVPCGDCCFSLCGVRLTQCCQNVPELSAHDCAITLFVKHPQTLNKVLKRSTVLGLADVLVHGQELVKVEHLALHVCGSNVMKLYVRHVSFYSQKSDVHIDSKGIDPCTDCA